MVPWGYHKRFKSIKYHGNWCGPGWSAGKFQGSVDSDYPAIDEFDETCKKHDRAYARGDDLREADLEFMRQNVGHGFKRSVAGYIVGAQGYFRSHTGTENSVMVKRSRSQSRGRSPARAVRARNRSAAPTPRATRNRSRGRSRTRASSTSVRRRLNFRRNSSSSRRSRSNRRSSNTNRTSGINFNGVTRLRSIGKISKLMANGVQSSIEQGNVTTSPECLYLGHATCPSVQMKKSLYRSLIKLILMEAGKLNPKWDANPVYCGGTDVIRLEYSLGSENGTTSVDVVFGGTQEDIANAFYTHFEGITNTQLLFVRISYIPNLAGNPGGIGAFTLSLQNALVEMQCDSQLRMQNRTVTLNVDNEADDVNNLPIKGRVYYGYGSGTRYVAPYQPYIPLFGDNTHGTIQRSGNTTELQEPPHPKLFESVTKSAFVELQPGEIITCTLRYGKTMLLQTLLLKVYDNYGDSQPNFRYKLKAMGEFSFYAFEKKIDAVAPASENDIRVAYEHELKVAMAIKPRKMTINTVVRSETIGGPVT